MQRARLFAVLVILAAVLLHLPGLLSVQAPRGKQELPEDGPALTRNAALAPVGHAPTADVLANAFGDPSAAWQPAGEVVARTRNRPLGTALLATLRVAGGDDAHRLAGGFALFLHALVAWLVFRLVLLARGPPAAALVAGLLVAASPHLGAAVGWPARLPVVAACLLSVLAVLVAWPGGPRRAVGAGVLAAAAGLTHETGFGAAFAIAALVAVLPGGVARRLAGAALAAFPSALAYLARTRALTPSAADLSDRARGLLDGAAGLSTTLLAPLLPTRIHLAGDAWTAGLGASIVAALALAVALTFSGLAALRAGERAPARLALAALASALPSLGIAWWGGAPHMAWYAAASWPLAAAALALWFVAAAGRAGPVRLAATTCCALLVAATVAATVRAAPDYRVRASFVARAYRADPGGAVSRAWRIGDALVAPAGSVADVARTMWLRENAEALAVDLVTPDGTLTDYGRRVSRDGAAAVTVASVLAEYVSSVVRVQAKPARADADARSDDGTWAWHLERPALAAAVVCEGWPRGWIVLADVQTALGAYGVTAAALTRAQALLPDDVPLAVAQGQALLQLGLTADATRALSAAYEAELVRSEKAGRPPSRDLALALVDALALEAQASADISAFRSGAEILRRLFGTGERGPEIRQAAYDLYLDYGDTLVSLDRPALALRAYQQAAGLAGPQSRAAEHLGWLDARLDAERRKADRELVLAIAEKGNVANAMLAVAVATARSGRWDDADAMFTTIASKQGDWNAPLRLARAVHLYAAQPDRLALAETELRGVLADAPDLADARYELGNVLVQLDRLREAAEEFRRAAVDGADREWAVEALEMVERIESALDGERLLR